MPEPPVAAPDHAALLERAIKFLPLRWKEFDEQEWTPRDEAFTALAALLAERQQDKQRIERLTEALERIASDRGWVPNFREVARAALADEEDAENG